MNGELLGTAPGKRLPENVTTANSASSRSIFLRLSGSVLGSSSGRGDPGLGRLTARMAAFSELDGKSAPEVACLTPGGRRRSRVVRALDDTDGRGCEAVRVE
jgi:hypothetical protein